MASRPPRQRGGPAQRVQPSNDPVPHLGQFQRSRATLRFGNQGGGRVVPTLGRTTDEAPRRRVPSLIPSPARARLETLVTAPRRTPVVRSCRLPVHLARPSLGRYPHARL